MYDEIRTKMTTRVYDPNVRECHLRIDFISGGTSWTYVTIQPEDREQGPKDVAEKIARGLHVCVTWMLEMDVLGNGQLP